MPITYFQDRVKAAKRLVEDLKKIPTLMEHINELERVFIAYISFVNMELEERKVNSYLLRTDRNWFA